VIVKCGSWMDGGLELCIFGVVMFGVVECGRVVVFLG